MMLWYQFLGERLTGSFPRSIGVVGGCLPFILVRDTYFPPGSNREKLIGACLILSFSFVTYLLFSLFRLNDSWLFYTLDVVSVIILN